MNTNPITDSGEAKNTPVELSVVIAATGLESSLRRCLAALESQRERIQLIVVGAEPSSAAVRAEFGWVEFHHCSGALVPELWREGIARGRGRIVALTIEQVVPAADWVESILLAHQEHDAVGGAIDPGHDLRPSDWAEYFCRYARDMAPFEPNDRDDLPGDNASYKRTLLVEEWEHLRDGFWEPVIHPILRRRGVRLWHTPAMLVRQGRSSGFATFARQRSVHGRRYAGQRGAHFSRARHVLGVLGSPVVPFLMMARVLRRVFAKRRYRLQAVAVLPLVFALNTVWGLAEARGHLELLFGE